MVASLFACCGVIHIVWIVIRAVDAVDGHAILFDDLERVSVANPMAARADSTGRIAGRARATAARRYSKRVIRPSRPVLGTKPPPFKDLAAVAEARPACTLIT